MGNNNLVPNAETSRFTRLRLRTGGTADATINSRLGLPSPSGNNNIVLNNATSFLTGFNDPSTVAPRDGIELATNWHLATLP